MDGQNRNYSLRLAGLQRYASTGTAVEEPSAQQVDLLAEPHADLAPDTVPAGTASGVADPTNHMRIDSFAAIAAGLDPDLRCLFEEAVATLQSLKSGREQVEIKLRETGRADAMRTVTGLTAMDIAIERTEAIIRTLGEMRRG
jgi:hypothetical protein